MPIRTAAQYLEGLRDDRHIQIDGERIKDVTTDRRFKLVAETMAGLFAMQHDKKLAPQLHLRIAEQRGGRRHDPPATQIQG